MSGRDTLTVARYDLRNARRSRILWGVIAVYVGFIGLLFYASSTSPSPRLRQTLFGAVFLTAVLLPLVAIAGSYLAIAGERESNTVRFLLSQPTRRRSVVLGKVLSRGVMVVGAFLLAIVVGVGIVLLTYPSPDLSVLVGFTGLTLLLIAAYTAVAIAVSAASATRSRAIAGAIAFYFVTDVFAVIQGLGLETLLRSVLGDFLGLDLTNRFYEFTVALLSPAQSYILATLQTLGRDEITIVQVAGDVPAYLQPPALAVVLLGWVGLAVTVALLAFDRTEIA
jgi:ABC-2 type transport system permease protein